MGGEGGLIVGLLYEVFGIYSPDADADTSGPCSCRVVIPGMSLGEPNVEEVEGRHPAK